jgi:Family of unknown function (DUF6494)
MTTPTPAPTTPRDLAHAALEEAFKGQIKLMFDDAYENLYAREHQQAHPTRVRNTYEGLVRTLAFCRAAVDESPGAPLNVSVRKFLKKVGVTSQREIEKAVRDAAARGGLQPNQKLATRMTLHVAGIDLRLEIDGRIEVD